MKTLTAKRLNWTALACIAVFAWGCDNKGPVEQAAEEIDEAVDTAKRGEESTATKLDDAVDEAREGVDDTKKELTE